MKKHLLLISAALAFGLTACGQPAEEATPSAAVTSSAEPTAMVTATVAPVTTVSAVPALPVPEHTPAEATAAPAPVPTMTPKPIVISTPEPVPTQTPEPSPEPTLETVPTPDLEQQSCPTDEEVLASYREAREAYNWFDLETLDAHQDEKVELDGILYAQVADERFPNMDSFRGYLKTLFSDEIVDSLLPIDGQQYVEIEGLLYVSEGARGTDITKGALTLSVIWPQEEESMSCTVQAEIELLDEETLSTVVGSESYEFPYQKVGDKWVFTHFESII